MKLFGRNKEIVKAMEEKPSEADIAQGPVTKSVAQAIENESSSEDLKKETKQTWTEWVASGFGYYAVNPESDQPKNVESSDDKDNATVDQPQAEDEKVRPKCCGFFCKKKHEHS